MEGLFGDGVGDTRNGVEEDLVVGGFDREWCAIRWRYGDLWGGPRVVEAKSVSSFAETCHG